MTSPPREPGAIPLLSHWAGQLCKGTAVLAIGTVLVTMALCLLAWVLRMSSLAFYGRMLAAAVWLMLSAAYGIVASLVLQLFGLAGLSQWTTGRAYKWAMWCTTGVGFEIVNGAEYLKAGPAVYIANHQTELDVLVLGTVFPRNCSVTAKKSLKWVPILGWFMSLSMTVFIDRGNRKTALAAFEGAAKHMRSQRQSVFIFPEGTRSYADQPTLLPFKKGAFHLAIQAQVPIIPIVVANYSHLISFQRRLFNSGTSPIKGLSVADVDDLIKRVRTAMEEELLSLTNTIPDRHRPAATDEDAVAWAGQKAGETVTADGRAMATSRKGKL